MTDKNASFRERAQHLIPAGCHTYAKGEDQYPENAPAYLVRGKGCRVWDGSGNEYIEYGMGLRAVLLGHAYEPVVEAAARQMRLGINFNRPASIEVECAEAFLERIDGADMVKFAKNGSDATTAAVRLARAFTGRDRVGICRDHPFLSFDDWFIGSTPMAAGIPRAICDLTVGFRYNDLESARALFQRYPEEIACLVLQPATTEDPRDGFLHRLRDLCHEKGALFVLDEMITGFRWHLGGGQKFYGVEPDLSTFGKAMANGFSIAALAGRREIMERGGLRHDRERVFLLSTTHGAETHALAAAIATMEACEREGVVEVLFRRGQRLRAGVEQAAAELGLDGYFELVGKDCNLIYLARDGDRKPSAAFRTLFLQETIQRGILAPSFVVSFAHTDPDIDQTVDAVREALGIYRRALEEGPEKYLVGPAVKPVLRRWN